MPTKRPSSFFTTKKGEVVVFQAPNAPLYLAFLFWLLRFLGDARLQAISHWGVGLALVYWAYLELFFGVNMWRRVLGFVVGCYFLRALVQLV